jgi:hypothetical protein
MTFSFHAKNRMMQRNKAAANLTPKELIALTLTAEVRLKGDVLCYLLKEIDLVLVVNPVNQVIVTCYKLSTAKSLQ